ncbi:LacI family DNA-binding transcriptional regulator [Marivita sp. GX14005]|uniref:LacI family DNA-binding transcriptional regulator n=1 Tax=Marivita sp. GX14005 TaxID=2942276 RepID=UPI0020185857|nr:LacI family DNA-binding transcriptional regulator [Marivita sp. GX14005]MCL3882914.1 LacI family DNA-binding transcriptional regulator [Marivita sp. GX14005]
MPDLPRGAPTLSDVARAAGVSTATVSRCLNAPERVVEKTRIRVLRAVEELGYVPNFSARAMAARRSFTIGAIIPTMENAIFARCLQAFQEGLHAHGYTLLLASSAYRPDLEAEQIKALVARGVDGLLLIGYERDDAIYDYLERRSVPTMLAWAYSPERPHASVGFDNRAAMRALTEKVLSFGHRRIALISGIIAGNDRAAGRLVGMRDALRAHGRDPADLTVIEAPYEIEAGGAAFAELMRSGAPPSAVMCGNDVLAVGALTRAKALGIEVPGNVSITGFDDIELAGIAEPGLTTVHVPHREMGAEAAEALIGMIEGRHAGRPHRLDVTITLRDSLGPAPAGEWCRRFDEG